MDSFSSPRTRVSTAPRRHKFFSTWLLLRIAFALVVSILIVMAFFATSALSR